MRLSCVVLLAAIFPVLSAAQPVNFQNGDSVTVVLGPGTAIKPGTKLRGTVTRCNEEGLGFRVTDHGTYWVKWGHIRSVNGKRVASDDASGGGAPFPAPASDPGNDASPTPRPETSDGFGWESRERRYADAEPVPRGRSRFDDESGRGWKYAGSFDYFGVGNAANSSDVKNLPSAACAATGSSSCAATLTVNGAVGFRGGFWKPANGYDWGASLGYLYGGPNGSGKLTVNVPGGSETITQSDNTVRLMGEVRKLVSLGDPWSFRMGAGLGVAFDFWNASCSSSGALAGICTAESLQSPESGSQTWVTWELSPAIAYGRWSAGLRYAGFGRTQSTPWNTFGGFIEAEF